MFFYVFYTKQALQSFLF